MNNSIIENNSEIAIVPMGRSIGVLYQILPTASFLNVEVTRSIVADRINEWGEIESMSANIPRIDFNSITGECRGILVGSNDIITIPSASAYIGTTEGSVFYQGDFTSSTDIHILGQDFNITNDIIRIYYTTSSIQYFVNNELISTKTGSFNWGGMNRIDLGNFMGSSNADCHIKKFIIAKNG